VAPRLWPVAVVCWCCPRMPALSLALYPSGWGVLRLDPWNGRGLR
jgi:hypothetical protein